MRKYVVGILIGFALSFAVGVHAEILTTIQSIIGQSVQGQFPVTVNGVKIAEPAAVIDNNGEPKGYLPIRAIGDSLGVEITFDSNLGVFINGKPKTVGDVVYNEESNKPQITPIDAKKIIIDNPLWQATIDLENADVVKQSMQDAIDRSERELTQAKRAKRSTEIIQQIEKGIQDLKDAKAELERKKAELSQ